MYSLYFASYAFIHCGEYETVNARLDELIAMATEKNAAQWRGGGMMHRGAIQALIGKASDAITMIPSGIAAWQSSGSVVFVPWYTSHHGEGEGRAGASYRGMAAHQGCFNGDGNDRGGLVRIRCPSYGGRNCAAGADAGCRQGGNAFPPRAGDRASAASKILGATRGNEPGDAVARPG